MPARVGVRPRLDERANDLRARVGPGEVEGREAVEVAGVGVRTGCDQQADDDRVGVPHRRAVKWRQGVFVTGVRVAAGAQELPPLAGRSERGAVQRRLGLRTFGDPRLVLKEAGKGVLVFCCGEEEIVAQRSEHMAPERPACGYGLQGRPFATSSPFRRTVTAALRPNGTIESKGVKSIRGRVANITEFLSAPITVDKLRERILERIFGDFIGRADVRELEARLCGLAFERDVVAGALSAGNPTDYLGDVSREDVLNILCP